MSTRNAATRIELPTGGRAYHSVPGISQSGLKLFADDPGKYYERYVLGIDQRSTSPSLQWGSDFENLIMFDRLPGVLVPNDVLSQSERDGKVVYSRRGAAWNEWKQRQIDEFGPDVRLLKQDEWDSQIAPLLVARDNVRDHFKASKLLDGENHVSLTWKDETTGLDCKCQIDVASRWKMLTDLKTAQDATPDGFNRAVLNFRYHWQAYWYREAWRRYTGEDWPFAFVVVQNKPSYFCETYDLHPDWYNLAAVQIRSTLDRLAQCLESGIWKSETFGRVITLRPPKWAFK